jgi:hypothetical protein
VPLLALWTSLPGAALTTENSEQRGPSFATPAPSSPDATAYLIAPKSSGDVGVLLKINPQRR